MQRRFSATLAILTVVLLTAVAPVRAQEVKDALGIIPADALAFAIINHPDQINDKALTMAKKVGAQLPFSPLDLLNGLGVGKGLNTKGCVAAAVLPTDGGDPVPLFLVPVSNYAEFVGQFDAKATGIADITLPNVGVKLSVAGKGKFALVVMAENKDRLPAILASKMNLTKHVMPVQEWVEGNDVTFMATPKGIKLGATTMRDGIAQVKQFPMEDFAFMKDWIDGLENFFKSAETDLSHAAIGIRIDKANNLSVEARGMFAKGSSFAKSSAGLKSMPGGPMASLPAGPYAMAIGGSVPPAMLESLSKIGLEVIKLEIKQAGGQVPEGMWKKLEESYSTMYKGLNGMTYVMRSGKGKTGVLGGTVVVMTTDNAAAYLEAYEKSIPLTNAIYKDLNLPSLPVTKLEKKIDQKTKTTIYESVADAAALNEDPMIKKMMEVMYGADGKVRYAQTALDAKTIIAGFTTAQGLQDAIKDVKKSSLKDDAEVARTLSLLPKDAQWVMLINPRGMTEMVGQVVDAVAPGALAIPEIPNTPPVGIGAKISETGFILQISVPSQVLEALSRLIPGQGA
jgi:hypothetical protein